MNHHFHKLSEALFQDLKSTEELSLQLQFEDIDYLRFNEAKIRQSTHVQQAELQFLFQSGNKKTQWQLNLTGHLGEDLIICRACLERGRQELAILPEDPYTLPLENGGASTATHSGQIPPLSELVLEITQQTQDVDFVGLLASGTSIAASRNSKGQNHWFSTNQMFLDYSLYTKNELQKNKAVKSGYATKNWSSQDWRENLAQAKLFITQLKTPPLALSPGKYRTFLAPAAVAELVSMLSWNALSLTALKQGQCAFEKLYNKEKQLSPKFSLKENFGLGLAPRFNPDGDLAPEEISLIHQGQLQNLLVNRKAQAEYGIKSNGSWCDPFGLEGLRSPEIAGGDLDEAQVLQALGTGVYLSNLHYLNWSDVSHARLTGMTRFACFWVEDGQIKCPINDMRFDDDLYRILGSELLAVTKQQHIEPSISTYYRRDLGGKKVPGLLLSEFEFTL